MKYVAICVALYDYQAQVDDEELSFNAGDVLYILENSDPDWYKAQLKVPSAQDGGPVGIIPSNYVEKAKPIGSVRAMYAYQPQSVEEVAFKEDEVLTLYENDDTDWFVVEKANGEIGLAPSNYVDQQEQQVVSTLSLSAPTPPSPPSAQQTAPSTILNRSDSALSWPVYEYDVIKKRTKAKGNLLVGNGMFCYGSETDKSSPVRQFQVNQVVNASIDGKNVHIEMNDTEHTVFDFETASQSEAKGILSKIESSKTASIAAVGMDLPLTTNTASDPVPALVATSPAPPCEPRWAIALFAFKPETDEETHLQEHEQVLITDYVTSSDWWTIEHKDGTAGIVPANYVKFQDEYEADLRAEEAEEEKRRSEAAAAAAAKEKQQRQMEELARKRKEEEVLLEKQRQTELAELNRQKDLEEKEKARQAEVDRRKKMQEEAKQKEIDAKRQAAFAANAMASPQMGGGSPRRSQIPAPPPPPPPPQAQRQPQQIAPLPTYNQQPHQPSKHVDPTKPDPAKVRLWTDRTGAFKVEAQFLSCANGKIRLFKTNGVKIDVPSQKMCVEDLKYIEQETGIKQYEDTNDNIPLARLNSQFTWFDYFKKANLPHSACVEYAGNFDANKLTQQDIERLTHGEMKVLGMSERHIQRIQRYIETNKAEPPSDNEGTGSSRAGGLAKPRIKVKKSVTFGAVSYIPEDGDSDYNEDDVEWQIQQDEIFARQLQEQEQGGSNSNAGLHRRGTGRPTPSHSAPRDVNFSVLTPQQFEPLKPVPAAPIQTPSAPPPSPPPVNSTPLRSAFEDDAWAPRASSSPSVQSAIAANSTWNTTAQKSSTLPANASIPPRQRPTAQVSQQSMVDPQLLAKWGGSPALAAANRRPVPPPPTTASSNFTPLQPQASFQSQSTDINLMLPQGSISSSPSFQPTTQAPASNGFQQQQQPTGSSFAPLPPSVQQQSLYANNNSSSPLNQYMYNQPSPNVVPLQSVLPPALAPQLTASSFQSTASSFGSPQLQPRTTGATAGGSNWTNATPDNPFGSCASGNPAMMQQSTASFVPQQSFGSNIMNSQIDPNDKYSVFKTINNSTPSVFNNQQQQQQQRSFYY
ncbi:hypothetical protein [Parasitella parasitica]|uniref:Actin cytoskeleton-regulatory complex protein SLA1 n=1 Tax=Parasitella parasitica TaxID=35722 RepID=A0A0B7NU74_9FUNG|nr:hypothetical protein [Parasitella parasitica]